MSGRSDLRELFRVKPKTRFRVADNDARATHGWEKDEAKAETAEQLHRLADLHDRLWAEAKHPVLVVMQGIDASGKDGAVRNVVGAFNPQGITISSFKVP